MFTTISALRLVVLACSCALLLGACGPETSGPAPAEPAAQATAPVADSATAPPPLDPTPFQDLELAEILNMNQRWTGDYDDLAERRFLRVLVPFSRTLYYLDGAEQKGIAYESLREFENQIPAIAGSKVKPKVVIIPTTRDRLLPALAEGYGDLAIGAFGVTELSSENVEFSEPTMSNVADVVVSGKGAAPILSEADFAGREIHVRLASSYHDDLVALNERLVAAGLKPVTIVEADARLEDEDFLQMVDAGIIPATVGKGPAVEFWAQIYDQLTVHSQVPLRSDGQIAWALRKGTPQLKQVVDAFVVEHRAGTLFGNVLLKRYLGNAERLKNPVSTAQLEKYRKVAEHFQTYAEEYGADWVLVVAQGFQESGLDQSLRSSAGAVGVMQIKPSTASDPNVGIENVEDLENNIHAGIKYMRFIRDRYFADEGLDPLDRGLFTLAAYNAGPARVASLRKKAAEVGLDPNQWFGNVEVIAAREIGRETVDYVGNIYKYYSAYSAFIAQHEAKSDSKVD
jgi:membrane-bound lytic murein transglycosylase MltF